MQGDSRSGYYRYLSTEGTRKLRELADRNVRVIILKAFNKRGYKKASRSMSRLSEAVRRLLYLLVGRLLENHLLYT